ncbi:TRADD-N-associated membrane domain-containing protein [Streptomyces drozdowiczii]|uniref:TRADD-N-associated membrane domain-containing protein n=1 Tax=Streptomyces drozdowiczii TaxID=202862 RepID=UPI0031EA6B2F
MSADEVLTQIVFWSTAFIVLFLSGRFIYRASDRAAQEVTEERQRLRQEVLGEAPTAAAYVDIRTEYVEDGPADDKDDETETRFARLLIEYYAYGLTQARRSFSVSLTCSVLGGLVLLAGIGMAILRAESTGDQYASVTASVAGLLMTVIGTLFHRRADLALKHMESQTQSLRLDMKVERDAGQAIRLLEDVDDPALKAHLQAALILKFSAAKLPELNGLLKPASTSVEPSVSGAVPQQQSESAAS